MIEADRFDCDVCGEQFPTCTECVRQRPHAEVGHVGNVGLAVCVDCMGNALVKREHEQHARAHVRRRIEPTTT